MYVCMYVVCMYVWSVDAVAKLMPLFFYVHTGRAASICFREWGYGHRAAAIGGGP
jgi:hypothetical protein